MSSILGGFAGLGGGSIGRASVDLVLNAQQYQAGLAAAEGETKSATASMGKGFSGFQNTVRQSFSGAQLAMVGFGAIAAVAIGKAVGATQEWSAEVRTLQRVTGDSAENTSKLAAAGNLLNLSTDKLNTGFGILAKNIINGSTNLTKYGVTLTDAQGNTLPFLEILGNLSDKFQTLQAGPEQAAFAMNAFGRSGKELIPVLARGRDGLQELYDKAQAAGLVMSQDTLDASKQLGIAQRELGDAVKGAAIQLGTAFLPVLTTVATMLTGFVELIQKVPGPVLAFGAGMAALAAATLVAIKVFNALKIAMIGSLPALINFVLVAAPVVIVMEAIAVHAQAMADNLTAMNAAVSAAASTLSDIANIAPTVGSALDGTSMSLVQFAVLFQYAVDTGAKAGQTFEQVATATRDKLTQSFSDGTITAYQFVQALEITGLSAKQAEGLMRQTAASSDTLTHHFDAAGRAVSNFAGLTGKALQDFSSSTADSMNFVEAKLGDLTSQAHITARGILRAFDQALQAENHFRTNSVKFLHEVGQNLGPGLQKAAEQMVQSLAQEGPQGARLIQQLADANATQQKRILRDWQNGSQGASTYAKRVTDVHDALQNLDGTTVTVTIQTNVESTGSGPADRALANGISRGLGE